MGRPSKLTDAQKAEARLRRAEDATLAELARIRFIIDNRVRAGLARARAEGKRLGRRPITEAVVAQIREQLATGAGILKAAKVLGVGTGTVHRVKREVAAVAA